LISIKCRTRFRRPRCGEVPPPPTDVRNICKYHATCKLARDAMEWQKKATEERVGRALRRRDGGEGEATSSVVKGAR
jgi:hypothetical protein